MLKSSWIRIFCYHSIDEDGSWFSVPPSLFQKHMECLNKQGYKVVSLYEAINDISIKKRPHKPLVVITFDDGFKNFYTHAFPVLKKFGYPATVFLVPKYINGVADWMKRDFSQIFFVNGNFSLNKIVFDAKKMELLRKRFKELNKLSLEHVITIFKKLDLLASLPILSWEEVQEMSQCGIDFGAHSYSHHFLNELTITEARDEIWRSKVEIEEHLNKTVRFFCYPYGAFNSNIKNIVKEFGFLGACSTQRGINHIIRNFDLYALARISMKANCRPLRLRFYLSFLYDSYLLWKQRWQVKAVHSE